MYRSVIWGLVLLVPLPAAWAREEKKADDNGTEIKGKLSPDDPRDKVQAKSPHKVHTMKWKIGESYQIDLVSRDFDAFLRLEDSAGKQLALDDDSGGMLNARIVFAVPRDDTYRIIATSLDGKAGNYTLTVRGASKAEAALGKVQADFQKALQSAQQKFVKAATEAEKEKIRDQFFEDAASYLERYLKVARDFPGDPAGAKARVQANQQLSMLGNVGSPAVAKTLRNLVEKSADKSIQNQASLVLAKVLRNQSEKAYENKDPKAPELFQEATKILRNLADKSTDKSIQAQAGLTLGEVLRGQYEKAYERKDPKAPEAYQEAENTLAEMSKKAEGNFVLANQFKNALFELQKLSVGKPAMEIEAEDLDGKKFKLSDYRGKVVVIDFWGNW